MAAIRAEETKRADRLFEDPFAERLAGDAGRAALAKYRASGGNLPIIEVRTRYYDERLMHATKQVVILAAGMDARAYRLKWAPGTKVYELDQPDVLDAKARVLSGATPACERLAVPTNFNADWAAPIDRTQPTTWLIEGLLQYLPREAVLALFAKVDALSAPGSGLLFDVVGQKLLDSPFMAPALTMMSDLGAPWVFGTNEPAALIPNWNAELTDPGDFGRPLGRWPLPPFPGLGYLVEAHKR